MTSVDPALFYTGLVAELYAPLRSVTPDPEPYARFVERWGVPALELGCGSGDPLLDLRARGLEVEGLDSSPDMLDRCRFAAGERGLEVVLHEQTMQAMALGRTYRTIYIAGPTFNLLPDDDAARRQVTTLRYERVTPTSSATEERPWLIHWHTHEGFHALAAAANLHVGTLRTPAGAAATPDDPIFVAVLTPARDSGAATEHTGG